MGVFAVAVALVDLHRETPEEQEWPPTSKLDLIVFLYGLGWDACSLGISFL